MRTSVASEWAMKRTIVIVVVVVVDIIVDDDNNSSANQWGADVRSAMCFSSGTYFSL